MKIVTITITLPDAVPPGAAREIGRDILGDTRRIYGEWIAKNRGTVQLTVGETVPTITFTNIKAAGN